MKRTIIYVFTPKRLQRDYQSGLRLPDFPLGWIKIGKTSSDNDDEDKWDVAYNRIKQEVRTGISETCVLVDVFEYPEILFIMDAGLQPTALAASEMHSQRFTSFPSVVY